MPAEAIGRVIADLRAKNVRRPHGLKTDDFALALGLASVDGPVVDATEIYHSLVARDDPVAIYEDHPCIAPPWRDASICYQNEHGNVMVMTLAVDDHQGPAGTIDKPLWETAEPIDWDDVRWSMNAFVWLGGRGHGIAVPTGGPVHLWQLAVAADGQPLDLHWVQLLPDYPMEQWDMAQLVLLGALNFCNCRNVELVEPHRPNAERKRILRTGTTVSEINVFPTGKSVRSAKGDRQGGTPLTSVRGHFAHYGEEYGRGLLFGKYSGRFWIPQFARGEREHGTVEHDYALRAEA